MVITHTNTTIGTAITMSTLRQPHVVFMLAHLNVPAHAVLFFRKISLEFYYNKLTLTNKLIKVSGQIWELVR